MSRNVWKSVKRHLGLVPLYLITTAGVVGAFAYGMRLALQNPDVQWDRRRGQIPNEEYRSKQYNFYAPTIDYSDLESAAPKYQESNNH